MLSARRQAGIALIEVLVSILLLAVGILAVVGLQGSMVKAQSDNRMRASATLLASDVVTSLWVDSAAKVPLYAGPLPGSDPLAARIVGSLPRGTATITGDASGEVVVAVSWTMPGETTARTVTQSAVITSTNETITP